MDDDTPPTETVDDGRSDSTAEVGFVVLAVLGLVVAAFLVPVVAAPGGTGPGNDSGGGDSTDDAPGDGGSGDAPDGGFNWYELLEWFLPEDDGDSTVSESRCTIALDRQPEPGGEVTARISYEGAPLADAQVWFNGDPVGTTNADGEVTGTVPYERELTIRADVPGRPDCRASTGGVQQSSGQVLSSPAFPPTLSVAPAAQSTPNASVTYPVDGTVTVDVRGRPAPGESLTVEAAINGRPFRGAAVFANGESVGETDADGTATVVVPDDGSERLRVRVARGDFEGTETVDVLLLSTSLRTEHLVALPGTEADVFAELGGEPTEAAVFVGGERRGTTDADGRRSIQLPLNPTTTVSVETDDQRATTSLADIYAVPTAVLTLVVALLAVAAYRVRGRRGVATVAAAVGALVAVIVADGLYGPTGRYAALAAVAVAVVVTAVYRWRRSITTGAAAAGGTLRWLAGVVARAAGSVRRLPDALRRFRASLVEWAHRNALRVADALGRLATMLVAGARRTLAYIRRLPRSISDFLARSGRYSVGELLGRAVRNPAAVALAVGAAATVVVYRFGGRLGAALAATATFAVALALRRRGIGDSEASGDSSLPDGHSPTPSRAADERSIRTLWRGFARLVAPNRWRSSTPEEIATAAVERGFPRRPVAELTRLFREVEYGNRSLSSAVRSRASDAYEAIRQRDRGDES